MIGTWVNTGAIVAGGLAGLAFGNLLSPAIQQRLRTGLAGLTTFAGLSMVWSGLQAGGYFTGLRQLGIALVALSVGGLVGHWLGLQRRLNQLGRFAANRFRPDSAAGMTAGTTAGASPVSRDPVAGFLTCTILFCVGPMAILGSIQDGLDGRWQVLGVKSLMDGFATMGFVAAYGWSPILAAVPVLLYQGAITMAAQRLEPLLAVQDLKDSLNITGGFIVVTITLIILEVRKVPLADYLPALVLAPLLAHGWWGR